MNLFVECVFFFCSSTLVSRELNYDDDVLAFLRFIYYEVSILFEIFYDDYDICNLLYVLVK